MAKIKVSTEMLAEMVFPGVDRIKITAAKMDDMERVIELEVEGPDVPIADVIKAVFTVRSTKHQRFVECELVAEPADEPSLF